MAEYFIGMPNHFDQKKFDRDFISPEFTGIEFCSFASDAEIQEIVEFTKLKNIKIGIHFPLNKSSYKYRDPLLMSLDEVEHRLAMDALHKEMNFAGEIKADYLLIHFPKPMILDKNLSWDKCRLVSYDQPIDQEEYPYELFKNKASELLDHLTELSRVSGVQVVLEIELINKYLYQGNLLRELLDQYPEIKICLDSARLHVLSKIDPEFDCLRFIEEMAPYTYLVHLSNIRVDEKIEQGHHPVLKRLAIDNGWCDIDQFLKVISQKNTDLKILYEHRSDIITDSELQECYEWVRSYFQTA